MRILRLAAIPTFILCAPATDPAGAAAGANAPPDSAGAPRVFASPSPDTWRYADAAASKSNAQREQQVEQHTDESNDDGSKGNKGK